MPQASRADQAGARLRACTRSICSPRMRRATWKVFAASTAAILRGNRQADELPADRWQLVFEPAALARHQRPVAARGERRGDVDRSALRASGLERRHDLQHGHCSTRSGLTTSGASRTSKGSEGESNRMSEPQLKHLRSGAGRPRARSPPACAAGKAPGIFWLGGFRSDMQGTKAEALDLWAGEARPRR